MLMLSLICLIIGAALGQRFTVPVLIPAMALTVAVATAFAHAGTYWQILGTVLVAATTLQLGYFAGVGTRYLTAVARTTRLNTYSHTTSPRRATIGQN